MKKLQIATVVLTLATDHVCSLRTIRHPDGLTTQAALHLIAAAGGHVHQIEIEGTGDRAGIKSPYLVASLHRRYGKLADSTLAHLAGLAEMRRMLGARPECWRHESEIAHLHYRDPYTYPDAYWIRPDGKRAWVEFDAGNYGRRVRRQKRNSVLNARVPYYWGDADARRVVRMERETAAAFEADMDEAQQEGRNRHHPYEFTCLRVPWHLGSEAETGLIRGNS